MKLNKETITVLQNFSEINRSIFIRKGNLITTKDAGSSIFAMVTVEDEIDIDIPIYALSDFLGILALFDDTATIKLVPEIEYQIQIEDNTSSTTFNICDKSLIDYSDVVLDEKTLPPPDIKIKLSEEVFNKIKKAAAILKHPNTLLSFYPENGKIWAKLYNPKEPKGNSYCLEVDDYTDNKDFNFVMKMDHFKILRNNYTVSLSKEGYIAFDDDNIRYVITLETEHTYFK